MTQIAGGTAIPLAHTAQLLDWAYGGPMPEVLRGRLEDARGVGLQAAE
jgi:glycolate oxidase iron-sulfur subunit